MSDLDKNGLSAHDRAVIAYAQRETLRSLLILVVCVIGFVACFAALVML